MAAKATSMEGVCLVSDGKGKNYSPSDGRFVDDDLMTLVRAGLLIPDFGSNGTPNYKITRAAVSLVRRHYSSH